MLAAVAPRALALNPIAMLKLPAPKALPLFFFDEQQRAEAELTRFSRRGARISSFRLKLCVVHNGIDVDRFSYCGPSRGGPIVTVGRLSPEKAIDNLICAMAIASKQEPSLRLEIAGA